MQAVIDQMVVLSIMLGLSCVVVYSWILRDLIERRWMR